MTENSPQTASMVPIDLISVVNPRARNRKVFKEIVANIAELGLKKPITVARRGSGSDVKYDLVCGQGRLEAYQALGQTAIPAFIIDADSASTMVMSLVENVARRQYRAIDLLHDIGGMKDRGYETPEIARKTGLSAEYVRGVVRLLKGGEHRLLRAAEAGLIPLTVAVGIADAGDTDAQIVLRQAYENKTLRGRRLLYARKLIEQRRRKGKALANPRDTKRPLSVQAVLRTYRDDADKKLLLVRKAETTRDRLVFVTEALRRLLGDDHFLTLLRAEGLDTLPQNISDRLAVQGVR